MKINGDDFHLVVLLFLSKKQMFQLKIWKRNTKNEVCPMTDGILEKKQIKKKEKNRLAEYYFLYAYSD